MKTRHHSRTAGLSALLLTLAFVLSSCSSANTKEADVFSGTTWIASDGSEMVFSKDGILSWYREEGVHDGDLVEGPYEAYRGQKAYDFIVDHLLRYGITRKQLDELLSQEKLDDLVVYTLEHQKAIMDGESYGADNEVIHYFGFFYDDDSRMEILNTKTGTLYRFTKKQP